MKLHAVGAELFQADRKTDRRTATTRLRVAFHDFANAPKNGTQLPTGCVTQFLTQKCRHTDFCNKSEKNHLNTNCKIKCLGYDNLTTNTDLSSE